jgi:hypothetical protein
VVLVAEELGSPVGPVPGGHQRAVDHDDSSSARFHRVGDELGEDLLQQRSELSESA